MSSLVNRLLRRIASLLVRGPDAPFVLGDLDEALRRDVERGVSPARAAWRYARNALGSALSLARARVAHTPHAARVAPSIGVSWLDVKLGVRMLGRRPLLTAVSVVSLAVGIPVGMAPGYIIDAFETPLPVEEGDRILTLRYWELKRPRPAPTTYEDFRFWRERLSAFGQLGAARRVEHNLDVAAGAPAPVASAEVSASTFSILRVPPLLGRTLTPADESPGAPPVVVLGHGVWQSRLSGDPQVVGRTVRVAGVPHTVVGVMPPDFLFPESERMWLPLGQPAAGDPAAGVPLRIFGRLAEGVTNEAAQAELNAVGVRPAPELPERLERVRAEAVAYAVAGNGVPAGGMRAIAGVRSAQLAAMLLLVVACGNVGLLTFARAATRSSELAVRTALGASRARLVGQVLTEALVLAIVATGAGLLLMAWLPDRIAAAIRSPDWGGMPYWIDFGLTRTTVTHALGLAVFSAAVAAILPALRVTGKAVQHSLQRARAGGAHAVRFGGVTTALIVADVALAVTGVGLTLGIAERKADIARAPELDGLATAEFLAVRVTLPAPSSIGSDAPDRAAWTTHAAATQQRLVERLGSEPGVRGVAVAERLPRMDHPGRVLEVEGGGRPTGYPIARVAPDFFEQLGQPALAGRGFHSGDLEGDRSAVIVNTGFVAKALGGGSAVGQRLRYRVSADGEWGPWYEIVGVVPNLGMNLAEPEELGAGIYHPAAPGEMNPLWLAIHAGRDPASFAPRLRALVGEVYPAAMISRLEPLDRVFPEDWYLMMGLVVAWTLFVGVLLALAASGVYAIMAFAVAQRTREIGIRTALGARPREVALTIGRRAWMQLGTGALLGMPIAAWVYQSVREDAASAGATFVAAALPGVGVMLLVGLLACTAPLLRALRIEPTEAMRSE